MPSDKFTVPMTVEVAAQRHRPTRPAGGSGGYGPTRTYSSGMAGDAWRGPIVESQVPYASRAVVVRTLGSNARDVPDHGLFTDHVAVASARNRHFLDGGIPVIRSGMAGGGMPVGLAAGLASVGVLPGVLPMGAPGGMPVLSVRNGGGMPGSAMLGGFSQHQEPGKALNVHFVPIARHHNPFS